MTQSTYRTVSFRCPEYLLDLIQETPETVNMTISQALRLALSKLFNAPEPVKRPNHKLQWTII